MMLSIIPDYKFKETADIYDKLLRDSFGGYNVIASEDNSVRHYYSAYRQNQLCIFYGSLYLSDVSDPVTYVANRSTGIEIFDIDGSFLYMEISADGDIKVFSEREGILPLYYRKKSDKVLISTECSLLFDDFNEEVIDYSSLYDYLRYGMLIGNKTFHREVFLLQGSSILTNRKGQLSVKKDRFFHHDSSVEERNLKILFNDLKSSYLNSVRKRIDRPISEMSVFLSGGMDSRLVLAGIKSVTSRDADKVQCISFGQYRSEEVDIARKVAEQNNNLFHSIHLSPQDYLRNADQYLKITCGSDMFPQSYIVDVARIIKQKGITAFFTGSFIECHIGGTFLPESAINTDELLSEYLPSHISEVKSELFKEEDFKEILLPDAFQRFFAGKTDNLRKEAKRYDDYPVKDIIQSFVIDNRDKRLVLNRETTPGLFLDYINPNFDKDFLEVAARIPAEERFQRKFYREFFVYCFPEYAEIVYNNTSLPVSAPLEMWELGRKNEYAREMMFFSMQKEFGCNTYYPHYYSDFDGYTRYDSGWINLFERVLFSKDTFLIGKVFDRKKVQKMYLDHKSGKRNYRKYLICLVSLELFFKIKWLKGEDR